MLTFEKLVEEARAGSQEALGAILESCRRVLLNFARRQTPRDLQVKKAPSDLVQDTFLEAYQDFHRFQGGSRDELLAWLWQILKHNFANVLRIFRDCGKRQVGREVSLDDEQAAPRESVEQALLAPGPSPSEAMAEREEDMQFQRAFAQLPEQYQFVLKLKYTARRTFEQIGQALGCSEDAARKQVFRALRRFAKDFDCSEVHLH